MLGYPTAVSPAANFRFVSAGLTGRALGVYSTLLSGFRRQVSLSAYQTFSYSTLLSGFRRQVSLSAYQTFSTETSSAFSPDDGAQGTVSRNVEWGRPFSARPR